VAKAIGWAALAGLVIIFALWRYLGTAGFVLLVVSIPTMYGVFRTAKWCFWPYSQLPKNRVRHQRIRLYLRLHPGRGHATLFELHRQWGRRAAYKRAAQVRP